MSMEFYKKDKCHDGRVLFLHYLLPAMIKSNSWKDSFTLMTVKVTHVKRNYARDTK